MTKNTQQPEPEEDEEMNAIAKQIRPLPANVVPSELFLRQMRKRILALQPKDATGRAA